MQQIDSVLAKYKGYEEQMFRNLAKKYNIDPTHFGLSAFPPNQGAATAFGSPPGPTSVGGAFGQTATLGGGGGMGLGVAPPTHTFGSASTMGSGFGQTTPLGGGTTFGSAAASASTFGSASPGFGTSSFGSLAQTSAPNNAFGGGFGSIAAGAGTTPGFGMPAPFGGGPRR